jgi:hypothetical protein
LDESDDEGIAVRGARTAAVSVHAGLYIGLSPINQIFPGSKILGLGLETEVQS